MVDNLIKLILRITSWCIDVIAFNCANIHPIRKTRLSPIGGRVKVNEYILQSALSQNVILPIQRFLFTEYGQKIVDWKKIFSHENPILFKIWLEMACQMKSSLL